MNYSSSIAVGTFAIIFLAIMFIAFLVSAAAYILNGFGIMNLCKRFGIKNGGLGFVPFANVFKLGQVADSSSALLGEKKKYSCLLLTLSIACCAMLIPLIITVFVIYIRFGYNMYYDNSLSSEAIIPGLFVILGIYFMLFALEIVYIVFYYIALHKIFKVTVPQNAVLFTVLSIIFSFSWLFLFIASLKNPPCEQPPYQQYQDQPPYPQHPEQPSQQ